ncbi:MAG: hypothetical protein PHV85_09405, partial [Desulfovibrionaceae bacterium]|nr:hypothetical protein [Desulfovibrionaceae bacterium]
GYAVAALRRDRATAPAAGLPADEEVHAAVALGWPEESYVRSAGRRRPVIRWFGGESKESGPGA